MDIGTYIQDNSHPAAVLHTFENVPERDQSSFFDDIDERQVIDEVINRQNNQNDSIGMHLNQVEDDLLARAEDLLQDESAEDKEVSVYALDSVQSILEVAQ